MSFKAFPGRVAREMSEFFGIYYSGEAFKLFSPVHMVSLLIILVCNILVYFLSHRFKREKLDILVRYSIAAALIGTELSFI